MPYHFHSLINLSRIPVNKGTNSRVGWTKYSDLYETVPIGANIDDDHVSNAPVMFLLVPTLAMTMLVMLLWVKYTWILMMFAHWSGTWERSIILRAPLQAHCKK